MATASRTFHRCGRLMKLVRREFPRIPACTASVQHRGIHALQAPVSVDQSAPLNNVIQQKRFFWKTLNRIANKPDLDRIKEAGPQRACAEWLVRCGAHIRWADTQRWERDFNSLPADVDDNFKTMKIAEVNASDSSVMYDGFVYFEGIDSIKKIRFHQCAYFGDDEATGLYRLRNSLNELEISSCDRLTDKGVLEVARIKSLKTLTLKNLSGVKDKDRTLQAFKQALPTCEVTWIGGAQSG